MEGGTGVEFGGREVQSLPQRGRRGRAVVDDEQKITGAEGGSADAEAYVDCLHGSGGGDEEEIERRLVAVKNYDYLDHPADVILHSWGTCFVCATNQIGAALFGYMTNSKNVQIREYREVKATGRDMQDLMFHFMDELLFLYGGEYFIARLVEVTGVRKVPSEKNKVLTKNGENGENDDGDDDDGDDDDSGDMYEVTAVARGEVFDTTRHDQGTEIKAITMHEMELRGVSDLHHLATQCWTSHRDHCNRRGPTQTSPLADADFEIFVLVDI